MTSGSARRVRPAPLAFGAAGALSLVCAATSALGQPSLPVDLVWIAPKSCPTQPAVLDMIRSFATDRDAQDRRLSAEATVLPNGDGYRLKLVIRSGDLVGERVIDSQSCRDLAGATAVAIGLLLQSSEPLRETDLSGSTEIATPEPPPPPATPARATSEARTDDEQPAADTRSSVRWLAQIPRVVLELGWLPDPSIGTGLALGVRGEKWQVLATVQMWAPQTIRAPNRDEPGAQLSRQSVELWTCRGQSALGLELSPCVNVTLDRLSGDGFGSDLRARSARVFWAAAGVGGIARWFALDWMALTLGASGRVALARPRIVIDGLGTVYQIAPAAFTASLGSEWIW